MVPDSPGLKNRHHIYRALESTGSRIPHSGHLLNKTQKRATSMRGTGTKNQFARGYGAGTFFI